MNFTVVLVAVIFAVVALVVVIAVLLVLLSFNRKQTKVEKPMLRENDRLGLYPDQTRKIKNRTVLDQYFSTPASDQQEKKQEREVLFYGELPQFELNLFSTEEIRCSLDQLDVLLRKLDGTKQGFFVVVSDPEGNTVQVSCDGITQTIDAQVSDLRSHRTYEGVLNFTDDIRYLISDYFTGKEIVSRYRLKES
jgi:hypothetical protein